MKNKEICSEATLFGIRVTPRKMMLVANLIRGKTVNDALGVLRFVKRKRVADYFTGLIKSAVANADQKKRVDVEALIVSRLEIGKGMTLKRFRARSMGRSTRINKKTSHIFLSLSERN